MQELPHHYRARAAAQAEGTVTLTAPGGEPIESAPPAEFGGPGDRWSPETLLVAAVADCFILTFRAIARASRLPWQALSCEVEGVLERVERVTRFTRLRVRARLELPAGGDRERAERLLAKAERGCLITSSLRAEVELETEIECPAVAEAG